MIQKLFVSLAMMGTLLLAVTSCGKVSQSTTEPDSKTAAATVVVIGEPSDGLGGGFELRLSPNGTWTIAEQPGGPNFFIAMQGTYMYSEAAAADKGTILFNIPHMRIGIVRNLNPQTAHSGDTGSQGNAEETGRTFRWKIQ